MNRSQSVGRDTRLQLEEMQYILRHWRDYLELCKPRVVALMVFTAIVGMLLASPDALPWNALVFGSLGIALSAGAAAAVNHLVDRRVDAQMARTRARPLPTGHLDTLEASLFALGIGVVGLGVLYFLVNPLTAVLTFVSLIGYAFIYTLYLKRATPQNIVIGGAAGAAPPMLGWTAVSGSVEPYALLLFLIVFIWTPPHFWALAIHRREEYAKVAIPMLPVTHGVDFTRLQILLYTVLLLAVSMLPYVTGMSGLLYLAAALFFGGVYVVHAVRLKLSDDPALPMQAFRYSITYLMAIFAALLLDAYLGVLLA
jgi:heme o synthase